MCVDLGGGANTEKVSVRFGSTYTDCTHRAPSSMMKMLCGEYRSALRTYISIGVCLYAHYVMCDV